MKLLTLNTHSLVEDNYVRKLRDFTEAVKKEAPEIIALQEVNQTACGAVTSKDRLKNYVPSDKSAVIREDNHAYNIVKNLRDRGMEYFWTWLPVKLGYNKYDEGLALLSLSPVLETDFFTVSGTDDYKNWKTRKLLGIRTENLPDEWFYSVQYGWWGDKEEPFEKQWERTLSKLKNKRNVWLMGDFNSPAQTRGEGYDLIAQSGWYDSFVIAEKKDCGITVSRAIDGWSGIAESTEGMRIDQIWCSKKRTVKYSEVLYNNVNYPTVSDHSGVMIYYDERRR